MSKSDNVAVRKTECIVPKMFRRADKQIEATLKELTRGYSGDIWDSVEELEELDTRGHQNHKQPLR